MKDFSNIVWPLWLLFVFGSFGVLESLGIHFEKVGGPWTSMSQWTWHWEGLLAWLPWAIFLGLLVACGLLLLHLVGHGGWPGSAFLGWIGRG